MTNYNTVGSGKVKIVATESLPILADNKTSITRGSAANSQGAKFESITHCFGFCQPNNRVKFDVGNAENMTGRVCNERY